MSCEELASEVIRKSSLEAKLKYPVHFLKHAFILLDAGRPDLFASACEEIGRLLADSDVPEKEKRRVFGELTLLSALGEYNDIGKMNTLIQQARELIGGRSSLISMTDAFLISFSMTRCLWTRRKKRPKRWARG